MEGSNYMEYGKVYLVPTPIGNLKDITLRALEVLENVDEIAAEDTRQSLKLLNHFNIKKPLFSYHQHNEQGKSDEILSKLEAGKNIAIVTDAGTPGISDPGSVVVRKCIENNIAFEVLPGATAITTALVYSGLDTTKFIFRGFIPRETKERKILAEEIKDKKQGSILLCVLSVLAFYVVSILQTLKGGFLFTVYDPANFNSIWLFAKTAGLVVLWIVANWMVCTLLGGRGRLKEIAVVTCYSLLPLIFEETISRFSVLGTTVFSLCCKIT